MSGAVDNVQPGDTWVFDEGVAEAFDNMLSRSIPGYDDMRRWVDMILSREIAGRSRPNVMDLGASRGEVVARFVGLDDVNFDLIEVSEPMRAVLRGRFGECPNVSVRDLDIRYEHHKFAGMEPDVIASVLTTVFTPISHRQAIVSSIRRALEPRRGLFVWVEKILGDSSEGDAFLTDVYYRMKADNGYTREAIDRKRLSLEFAQVPLAPDWNESILRQAGFRWHQRFWQSLNFCGWVAQA